VYERLSFAPLSYRQAKPRILPELSYPVRMCSQSVFLGSRGRISYRFGRQHLFYGLQPSDMNKTTFSFLLTLALILGVFCTTPRAEAVDGLLLQDAYVDNATTGSPVPNSTNYGSNNDLRVLKNANHACRSFLKFSVGTLPSGTTANDVTQARLRLWVNNPTGTLGPITLTPVTSAWDESTIKNNNTGSMTFGTPKISDLSVNSTNAFISIDVTDWVKAWISGTLTNEGFQIETATGTSNLSINFDSKESSLTSHEPVLEIVLGTVGLQGPTGPQGTVGATGATGSQGIAGVTGPNGVTGPQGPGGATGGTGAQGAAGPTGPTGIMGAKGLDWKGDWSNATSYVKDDAVVAGGSAYVALQSSTSVPPPSSGTWSLLAQKGDAGVIGPQGTVGVTGAQGTAGATGPAGAIGAQGLAGPIGATGPTGSKGDTGDLGPQGAVGSQGVVGATGAPGNGAGMKHTYLTDTNNTDPGSGNLKLDSIEFGSATELRISKTDGDGNNIAGFLNTWGDSTSSIHGYFFMQKDSSPGRYSILAVTGAVADHGTWVSVGVENVVTGGGSFANSDAVRISFLRAGDKGDSGATGVQGPTGTIGVAGPQGLAGATGPAGLLGPIGPAGAQGSQGVAGANGAAGPQGLQGLEGPTGSWPTHLSPMGDLSMGEFTNGPIP
jgi:hypothetical protein